MSRIVLHWREARKQAMSASDILTAFDISEPPVPIMKIMREMGILVVAAELENPELTGSMRVDAKTRLATCRVKASAVTEHRRFSAAHELGHLVRHPMHMLTEGVFRDMGFSGGDSYEVDANRFAAAMLMPMFMLRPMAGPMGYNIDDLAAAFIVSRRAMEIRMLKLAGG